MVLTIGPTVALIAALVFASHKGSEKTWGLKYPKTGGYSQKVVIETKNDAP